MIRGTVNDDLEATLPLQVFGPTGAFENVTAVIDTGYNGSLSLPPAAASTLALVPLPSGIVTLGDGRRTVQRFFRATITWDGQLRSVRVLCVEGAPLVGTGLLESYELKTQFRPGGDVALVALP